MKLNMRREQRRQHKVDYSVCWRDEVGLMKSVQVRSVDFSSSGVCVRLSMELPVDHSVFLQAPNGHPSGYATVRHCSFRAGEYYVGLEFTVDTKETVSGPVPEEEMDYYEFLQISPKAEFATIQRIYRFLAARFHPDNPETGDAEKFVLLNQAYDVLSEPQKRLEYDARRESHEVKRDPIFDSPEFVIGLEGEVNRRLGVLSLLYHRRRTNPENPRVSLPELEKRMGWPREYLDFTMWYLRNKQYVTREDNSDFALSVLGVDYVEQNRDGIPILQKLLGAGARTATSVRFNGKSKVGSNLYLAAATELSDAGQVASAAPESP